LTLKFDLGTSIFHGDTVASIFQQRFWPTISVVLMAKLVSLAIAIPLGVIAAYKANTIWDRAIMVYVVAGFAIPGYFLAYLLIFLFAVQLGWLPAIGYVSIAEGVGPWLSHLVLPTLSLSVIGSALTTRITRSTMLEVLREDYIRTARAKGLASGTILVRHALKNASIPIATIVGLGLATLIGGVVLIEVVFAIPGMGRATVEAMLRRDYPVIQGLILIVGLTFVVINLLTDVLYAYLDPRIRY
jgi:peptide/nickel transport system permease protein